MNLTYDQAITRLRQHIGDAGSQKVMAYRLGVTEAYLSDVLSGRRAIGPKVLKELKLEKVTVVSYREIS